MRIVGGKFLFSRMHVIAPWYPHMLPLFIGFIEDPHSRGKRMANRVTISLLCWELYSFTSVSSRGTCDRNSFRSCWLTQTINSLSGEATPSVSHSFHTEDGLWRSRGVTIPWQSFIPRMKCGVSQLPMRHGPRQCNEWICACFIKEAVEKSFVFYNSNNSSVIICNGKTNIYKTMKNPWLQSLDTFK